MRAEESVEDPWVIYTGDSEPGAADGWNGEGGSVAAGLAGSRVLRGGEVLNYCVMSNHFHILVRVPDQRSK